MADLNGSETPWSVSPIVIDIERDKIDYCVYIDKEGETVVLGRKGEGDDIKPDITIHQKRENTQNDPRLRSKTTFTVVIEFQRNGHNYRLTAVEARCVFERGITPNAEIVRQNEWELGRYKLEIQQSNGEWTTIDINRITPKSKADSNNLLNQPLNILNQWLSLLNPGLSLLNPNCPQVAPIREILISVRKTLNDFSITP